MNVISAQDIVMPDLPDGPLLVAVSGGADSVALLNILHRLIKPAADALIVAHFHHGIRGDEADRDAEAVRRLAIQLGLPCLLGRANIPNIAAHTGESLEMAARRLRHDFLQEAAISHHCTAIATGHTADDQLETLFLRLARGTSLRGAGGMRPISEIPGAVPLIRPLINLRHAQLCAWLEAESIPWHEDSTNADDHIARNRIRHGMTAAFESDMGSQAVTAATRSMALFRDDCALLDSMARDKARDCTLSATSLALTELRKQPLPLFRRILADWLYHAGLQPEFVSLSIIDRVERLCDGVDRGTIEATIGGGWLVRRCNGILDVVAPTSDETNRPNKIPSDLSFTIPPSDASYGPVQLAPDAPALLVCLSPTGSLVKSRRASPLMLPLSCCLSATAVAGRLTLRAPQPGDRISPVGSGMTQKISDILTNLKIPRTRRQEVPLLVREDGRVVWLPGYAVDESVAVRENRNSIQIRLIASDAQQKDAK